MAKGDSSKAQYQIDHQGNVAQQGLETTRNRAAEATNQYQNQYNDAYSQDRDTYNTIQGDYGNFINNVDQRFAPSMLGYQNLASGSRDMSFDPAFRGRLDEALSGYSQFSKDGGFTPEAIQDLRARAIAPTRSVFSSAQRNLDRQKTLQGGYSPGYTAATGQLTRDLGQGISDANINANASIAQMVQQGKLAGLGGLTAGSTAGQGLQTDIDSMNNATRIAGLSGMNDTQNSAMQAILNAMAGRTNAYGTTPGMSSMAGQFAQNSRGQELSAQQLQNAIAQMLITGQINKSQVPSNYQQALANIGGTVSLAGNVMSGGTLGAMRGGGGGH